MFSGWFKTKKPPASADGSIIDYVGSVDPKTYFLIKNTSPAKYLCFRPKNQISLDGGPTWSIIILTCLGVNLRPLYLPRPTIAFSQTANVFAETS